MGKIFACCSRKKVFFNPCIYFLFITAGLLFTTCQKSDLTSIRDRTGIITCQTPNLTLEKNQQGRIESTKINTEANPLSQYEGLSSQTTWELQQARAASAKYQKLENAIADGYRDINVNVQFMGHHYMNTSLLDGNFDIEHPEILVYNRDEKGVMQLVAVEYAIPLNDPKPEGFTGSADVWDGNKGFGLWLLHAWVWYPNPDGVFNPTNPLIQLR